MSHKKNLPLNLQLQLESGLSVEELANSLGISKQAMYQRYNLLAVREQKRKERARQIIERIDRAVRAGNTTITTIAFALNTLPGTISFWCKRYQIQLPRNFDEIIGKKINDWTVIERVIPGSPIAYHCQCSCGRFSTVEKRNLLYGLSKRCISCAAKNRKNRQK